MSPSHEEDTTGESTLSPRDRALLAALEGLYESDEPKTETTSPRPTPERAEILEKQALDLILVRLREQAQPSAGELLEVAERILGWEVRWVFRSAIERLRTMNFCPQYLRDYIRSVLSEEEIDEALAGDEEKKRIYQSTLDELVRNSSSYRGNGAFQEMIRFTACLRDYSPYNNLLVKLQKPACAYYATARDWKRRFNRDLIDDARPLVILAPMHPVMLVYDLDQTEGPELPQALRDFGRTEGKFEERWMENLLHNAERDRILVQFKELSSSLGGFATTRLRDDRYKMRIAIHSGLERPAAFSVLCHELTHIYLGHLGGDPDGWWPCRINLSHQTVEIEAEATAYIVGIHLGLRPMSEAYLSTYFREDRIPESVSVDLIAKRAGKLLEMANRKLPERKQQQRP